MAWVAFDRAVAGGRTLRPRRARSSAGATLRDEIHDEVCRNGFNPALGAFTQIYGGKHLDASLLLMPIVGFLPPNDPRIVGTVAADRETAHA